jgi:hypothetical protein
MFFDDEKKAVTTIMSRRSPKGERTMEPTPMKNEEVKTEDGTIDPKHMAAQEIIAAHHSQSPEKLKEALGNFMDLHMSEAHEE